jgi:predicted DNA-binding transcriptional regulator YafY
MSQPTTRVLALLELLQSHCRMNGAELASRIGVDRRTLRRYIVMLEEIGIPITTELGRHGGYALVAGFKLPPMMFTEDEALAISLGLVAARGLGLAEGTPAVASAQAKLERIMPAALQKKVRAIDETVALSLSNATAPGSNMALVALSAAAQQRRRVTLHYRDPQQRDTSRPFDCYGLVYRGGFWYAAGRCHMRKDLRTFRLDRIRSVAPLVLSFERPKKFDALKHLVQSLATLPRTHAIEVFINTDLKQAKDHLFETIGLFEASDDGVIVRAQADDLAWFARQLARLPFEFEIIKPRALRVALKAHAQKLLKRAK